MALNRRNFLRQILLSIGILATEFAGHAALVNNN